MQDEQHFAIAAGQGRQSHATVVPRWSADLVKSLLRTPSDLLRDPLWREWFRQRDGLAGVYAHLRQLPLSADEQKHLGVLLERPGEQAETYARRLGVNRSAYFNRFRRLLEILATHLNAWDLAPVAQPQAQGAIPAPGLVDERSLGPAQALPPASLTSFVGREHELATLCALLERPQLRLLTLTGAGGVGKTRLAAEVMGALAERYQHGAVFVSLAPLLGPELVEPALLQALGVREADGRAAIDQLVALLEDKHLLIVLDNFEHVRAAAPIIGELIARAPGLKLLITSRTVLHLRGEQEFNVQPLELPGASGPLTPAEALAASSVALFVERARTVQSGFQLTTENVGSVVEICRRLDGLPLALELAAARLKLLTPDELAGRLTNRLALLTHGFVDLPERHQTLRRTMDWSYALLTPQEQHVFAWLGVFAASFTLEAAAALLGGSGAGPGRGHAPSIEVLDNVSALLDHSLLQRHPEEPGRFIMLETVREYALEQLAASAEQDRAWRRYAEYYLALAEQAEPGPWGLQQDSLRRLVEEEAHLRSACGWAVERAESVLALRLTSSLGPFWAEHGSLSEGLRWLEATLRLSSPAETGPWRARALYWAGNLAKSLGDYDHAGMLAEASLAGRRELGARQEIAQSLILLAMIQLERGRYGEAIRYCQEGLSLYRELSDPQGEVLCVFTLGMIAMKTGDYPGAMLLIEESMALNQRLGNVEFAAGALLHLGIIARLQEELARAEALLEQSLALCQRLDARNMHGYVLLNLGQVGTRLGQLERAARFLRASLQIFWQIGHQQGLVYALEASAELALRQPQLAAWQHAALLFGAAESLRTSLGTPRPPADQPRYDALVGALQAAGDERVVEACWCNGRALTLELMVSAALEVTRETLALPA